MEVETMTKKRIGTSVILVFGIVLVVMALPAQSQTKGHWDFGFHYSRWSINLLRSAIEEGLSDALETDLRDQILEDIQADYPNLIETSYNQEVQFDSGGDNFGFEVRYYPGGENGSFSIGLSVEKTSMRVSLPEVSASLSLEDGITQQEAHFNASSTAEFLFKPWSFHLSFRWDLFPSSVVHPYITLGVGAATASALENAKVSYSYTGELFIPGEAAEQYSDSVNKSIKELKDEMEAEGEEFFLPGIFPFLQLNLGLKAMITPSIHLLVDAGIWNGFLIRGGVSIRL
jgi:opacity protein-like surface antigen